MFAHSKSSKNGSQQNVLNGEWKYELIKRMTIITIVK